jgi:hypothetical protein
MTAYATLTDPIGGTTIEFVASGNFQQTVHENAALYEPLGYQGFVKSTDGTKGLGGILAITATSDEMNANVRTLMQVVTPLTLTLPNGDEYSIMWDPQTDRKATAQFSLLNWQPVWEWTAYYVQVVD